MYLLYLKGTNEGPFEGPFVLLLSIATAIQSFMESFRKAFPKATTPIQMHLLEHHNYNGPTECMSGLVFLESRVPNLCMQS